MPELAATATVGDLHPLRGKIGLLFIYIYICIHGYSYREFNRDINQLLKEY